MHPSHRTLLGEQSWSALCALAPARSRPTRSVLLRQGDPGTHVLALASGSAVIARRDDRGTRSLLAVRAAGELLGELSLLDGGVRSATVIAAEPCSVHVVPAAEFRQFVAERDLLPLLLRRAVSRIRESEEVRQELATSPVPVRLASALLRLALSARSRPREPVTIRLTQDELAELIGASRNSVVQALAPWREQGWVRVQAGGGLTVIDSGSLRRVVGAG
ncbi:MULTISPECIES: Crp/Fnr family transcriptional regulator [Streptomyces]|uniref:Crp/Fnr family transcriptional regulator n=1 Tax=Streptomyces cacaoi TaxID=1898 RepID=A0A4Y3R7L2_STRCI|nr:MULTISPECIES: Crp/Fnr family transcriptional regulator [Streptomyces]NNG85672.1 Crp/Fnr family transcriptional regulator [Streptomyces cacaoi]QHF96456.1 Crp/Fnr family transcriptional regulator [Streptomyces sp. NHF165]GEB53612.1 Crp/Fnr family transcriptional regulator [Streptomyces cacaoi]